MRKDDDCEVIDMDAGFPDDVDAPDIGGLPDDASGPAGASSATGSALALRSSSAGALVPYKQASVPALVSPLGDLQAFIRAANAAPILTPEEEKTLAVRLRDSGDLQAAQQLVMSHLRLVVSIARGYLGYGLAFADLIQEGNVGLMKAIKHYDPDRGARLMTFAVHWIRSEIQEYIVRNWRLVKLATTKNQRKLFFNLRQLKGDTKTLTGEQTRAIARQLEVKPEEVREMETRLAGADTPLDRTSDGDADDDPSSMAPIDWLGDEQTEPQHILAERAKEQLAHEGLRRAIDSLDERSRRVITARWLPDQTGSDKAMTLQELAAELGVSAERVRQIEKKAIAQLRRALSGQEDVLQED